MNEYLTREQADALPDGARVEVNWSGGNGPHEYVVRRIRDAVYVECLGTYGRGIQHRLDFVGTARPFTLVRRLPDENGGQT